MKLLHITSAYPDYLKRFYAVRNYLESKTYEEQQNAIFQDAFAWADFWSLALQKQKVETLEILYNAEPLQRAWWRENGANFSPILEKIAIEQARRFGPDVLWFDDTSELLLKELKSSVPSIRLVIGWCGSAISNPAVFQHTDLVLSCAQESVEKLRSMGIAAEQLHHGFDPRILSRIENRESKKYPFSFVGQVVRGSQFHDERARLLESLVAHTDLTIFSSLADLDWRDDLKFYVKRSMHFGKQVLAGTKSLAKPINQRNPKLAANLLPAVYGLEMYQKLKDSSVVLNIHADSSPHFASNMRLFETTGTGSCLLTDWRPNLKDLFILDKEVVTYQSHEECLEKAKWLLNHPEEAARIADAGQRRSLKDHTFDKRAERLIQILSEHL